MKEQGTLGGGALAPVVPIPRAISTPLCLSLHFQGLKLYGLSVRAQALGEITLFSMVLWLVED